MAEHTPTPWHADDTAIFASDGVLARIPNHPENGKNWKVDAAFIVKAVNSHDALVKLLKAYEQWEADIILENKCWTGQNVQLTDDLYERMIQLQAERNRVLGDVGAPDSK
jgi:hypothetical protein